MDRLGPVSNSPPPARCIRLLPDPKASRVPGHVVPSVHRDPFEVVLLFGAERMEFKSPSSLRLNSATTRNVLFQNESTHTEGEHAVSCRFCLWACILRPWTTLQYLLCCPHKRSFRFLLLDRVAYDPRYYLMANYNRTKNPAPSTKFDHGLSYWWVGRYLALMDGTYTGCI